jgi:predicted DNA-binding transcriptional regulator YafY
MPKLNRDIMSVLPEEGKSGEPVSTPTVWEALKAIELDVPSVKTIQRRLERLEDDGFVESERRGRALYWRRKAGAGGLAAKSGSMMTFDEALALQTLRRFSSRQIPALVASALFTMFDVAQARLSKSNSDDERHYARWANKVAVESGAFALFYPKVDAKIFASISDALFSERKLRVVYSTRLQLSKSKSTVVMPLGLVEMAGLVYLIAQTEGHENPTMYRVDRFVDAAMLLDSFAYPPTFSLDSYIKQQRQFDFLTEGEVWLRLRFRNAAGDHLLEAPFAADQEVKRDGACLEVQGTAILSRRLRWWLRSFGPNIEVLAPADLRTELAMEFQELAAMYRSEPDGART